MKFGLLNKCVGCPIPLLVDFEHVTGLKEVIQIADP
jgi:hypothetical protein